jgi:hypothetical protein
MAASDELRRNTLAADLEEEQDRIEALKFERLRVVSKYGENSPRAAALTAAINARGNLAEDLRAEHERASTPVPKTSPREAVLYGRVMTKDGRGAAKVSVAVIPQAVGPVGVPGQTPAPGAPKPATAVTDGNGRFEIRLTAAERLPVLMELSFGGRLIYRDPEPFSLAAGAATYREITVDLEGGAGGGTTPRPKKAAAKRK